MKTSILKSGVGVLQVTASLIDKQSGTLMYARFPAETLFQWYPLNPQYTYRYSEKNDLYYLVVDNDNLIVERYGVKDNKGGVTKNRSHIKQGTHTGAPLWINEDVSEANLKVFSFAKRMGVVTPLKVWTANEVANGFKTVQKALDALYEVALTRCVAEPEIKSEEPLDNMSSREYNGKVFYEYNPVAEHTTVGCDEETRAEVALHTLTQEENELYIQLGEVYTMLTLMSKILVAVDANED